MLRRIHVSFGGLTWLTKSLQKSWAPPHGNWLKLFSGVNPSALGARSVSSFPYITCEFIGVSRFRGYWFLLSYDMDDFCICSTTQVCGLKCVDGVCYSCDCKTAPHLPVLSIMLTHNTSPNYTHNHTHTHTHLS